MNNKQHHIGFIENLFFFSLLLKMYSSMRLFFMWRFPVTFIGYLLIFSSILYIVHSRQSKLGQKKLGVIVFLFVTILYELLVAYNLTLPIFVVLFSSFLGISTLILTTLEEKKYFLRLVTKITAGFITISIIGWIPFLLGIQMPHYFSDTSIFYQHQVYHFFIVGAGFEDSIFPRFMSYFLEPGHMSTTASFLLFANKFNMRRWENWIFLIAVLLSLSLAGYGLLLGGMSLYFIFQMKRHLLFFLIYVIFISLITVFIMNYNKGNNAVNNLIVERLEFENGEMSGNNRFSQFFEYRYKNFLKTDDRFWGIRKDVFTDNEEKNWTIGSAGWKRFILTHGYIGVGLVLLLYIAIFAFYRSKMSLGFFIIAIVANCIRDYPLSDLWLCIYIIAMFGFYYNEVNVKRRKKEFVI